MKDTRAERIISVFNNLRSDNVEILEGFYRPDVHFVDSVGEVKGLENLKKYYTKMYAPVTAISFEFPHMWTDGDTYTGEWIMRYRSTKLRRGAELTVPGCSRITFDPETELVSYHRDYFDLGALLYEHLPIFSPLIRGLKRRFHVNES